MYDNHMGPDMFNLFGKNCCHFFIHQSEAMCAFSQTGIFILFCRNNNLRLLYVLIAQNKQLNEMALLNTQKYIFRVMNMKNDL